MAQLSSLRSRLGPAARWLAPSLVAAAAGGLAAGLVEALRFDGPARMTAATGFVVLLVVPALFATSAILRAIAGAWRPAELAASLREAGGAMPRLAGWVLAVQLAALGLAWATFQGTWQLASKTAFKPLTVGFALPVLAVATVALAAAASRPAATLFAAIARALDRRWRRRGWRTLLTPRRIALGAAITSLVVAYVLWRLLVRPRTGPLAITFLHAPLVAIAIAAVTHGVWHRLGGARLIVGALIVAIALAAMGIALATRAAHPARALAIWGERSLAAVAIETLLDLDRIRDDLPLATMRPAARTGDAGHPDIVLVTIAAVRADRTPPYGGTAEMPVLEELAQRGSRFTWAFAPSNVSWRSLPAIALGLDPRRVRTRRQGVPLRLDPRHVVLAERLRAGGYETAGFACCAELWSRRARTGLARGFDHLAIEADDDALARAASTWLAARATRPTTRPLFAWLHLGDVRDAGDAGDAGDADEPPEVVERRRRYDVALSAADRALGAVLRELANRPRPAIVIVTSDHGEGLGDHGQPDHGDHLYNSQLRVPLVIVGPGIKPQVIQETVSLVGLAPTVLELAGFVAPRADAAAFAELATGARGPHADGGQAHAVMSSPGRASLVQTAIVVGRWKLIDHGASQELYNLAVDPDEHSNQATVRTDLLVHLRRLLEQDHAAMTRAPF